MGRPEGNRPVGRTRRRCADNIKMDLQEIEWGGRVWIDVAEYMGMWLTVKVKKVKAVCGFYSTAALRHIVLLPE